MDLYFIIMDYYYNPIYSIIIIIYNQYYYNTIHHNFIESITPLPIAARFTWSVRG